MSEPTDAALLDMAEAVARTAGAALSAQRAAWAAVEAVQGREVKIAADREAEALILAGLAQGASYPALSEEAGWVGRTGAARFWAVDPLDGSVNYLLGYPHWGVSIALLEGARPILGVFHNPALDETYAGLVGAGARRNGRSIRVSTVASPSEGVLATGIPARARTDDAAFAAFMGRLKPWRKVRMIGSAAAALAYVASGQADAYAESGTMLWDVAAGLALVEAAGGRVRVAGDPLAGPIDVLTDNGRVSF